MQPTSCDLQSNSLCDQILEDSIREGHIDLHRGSDLGSEKKAIPKKQKRNEEEKTINIWALTLEIIDSPKKNENQQSKINSNQN